MLFRSVMKNAIDWASRGPDSPLNGKPVGITGAAMGMAGTAQAQHHLRQIAVNVNMLPFNKPEVFVAVAHTKFDVEGNLTDEPTKEFVRAFLVALRDWTLRLSNA